jgi:chaperone BCS1
MHKHLCDLMSRARVNRQFIDCPNAYGHSMTLTAPLRGFDSIVLNPENETRLHKHLSWFKASRSLFSSRGMSYKTGILLEGPPGTGKTSVCRAIANDLGYRIRLGDLSHIRDVLGQMEPKTLLLIEDIDKFIGDVAENNVKLRSEVEDNELSELDSDFESDSGVVSGSTRDIRHAQESRRLAEEGLQHLMQFMDGMTSMDDTVIVLTTNYPDRLPPELLRNGRIDLRLHIGLFGRPEAERLCRLFGHTDGRTISQLLDTIGSSTWSLPSTLHGILLGMDKHGVET